MALAAAGLTMSALLGVILWQISGFRDEFGALSGKAVSQEVSLGSIPLDLPLALVADYYEHIEEHVPPRRDGGVMQMREVHYQPPQDPFVLLGSRLRSASPQDSTYADDLSRAEDHWLKTGKLAAEDAKAIEALSASPSLDANTLLEAGRGFQFLVGDDLAATMYRAAMVDAEAESKGAQAGDPSALTFLHLLDQTKALYRVNDQAALAERFTLATRLYPALSVESRRAACLCAKALSNRGKAQEAADMILTAWRQNSQAADLNDADMGEIDWLAAKYLSAADRYAEAVPYCAEFVRTSRDESRKKELGFLWKICLNRLGNTPEAEELRAKFPPPQTIAKAQTATSSPGH